MKKAEEMDGEGRWMHTLMEPHPMNDCNMGALELR